MIINPITPMRWHTSDSHDKYHNIIINNACNDNNINYSIN